MNKVLVVYFGITFMFILVCLIIVLGVSTDPPPTPEPMKIELIWHYTLTNCETERDLALTRIDIHKRQISRLETEIDGLRTIILGDSKLKHLLED